MVQGSALWCARQRWTSTRRGACEAGFGGRGVAQAATAWSKRRAIRAWHRGGSDRERWWLVRAAAVQGKNSGHRRRHSALGWLRRRSEKN